ncbi:hypothetical protein [Leptospira brenneri]|uniref:Uncharacterized protein n=1 Tax=Leptospira brenneri TaxID=2023182 RepID=A0A2M9XYS6_9LEPT|nr:hypothetical protein [Leptospira brenneri]PJZ44313.1 hypothetical protein CH361_16890 [Leptospira brenneri]TGK92979.1 hypothetical protein EHQ30_12150 [Leptospira brenneri]
MKIVKVLFILSVSFLLLNCEDKKDTACAEDIVCSYLLVNSTVKGNLYITASTGAVNNAGTYTVTVHSAENCADTAIKTSSFSESGSKMSEFYLSSFSTNATYSVKASAGGTTLCSTSFAYSIDKQTVNCRIAASAITCN